MSKKLKLTFGYEDTEFTRDYNFEVADSITASCKDIILDINASLKAGTDGGLGEFFISDEADNFVSIVGGQLETTDITVLTIGGDSAASIS